MRLARSGVARALEWLPAHQLAAAEFVDAGVASNAKQPRLDFECDRRATVPGALGLFPGGKGQVVTVVGITHESLDLAEDGGIVRGERFFDGDRIAARLGHGGASAMRMYPLYGPAITPGLCQDYGRITDRHFDPRIRGLLGGGRHRPRRLGGAVGRQALDARVARVGHVQAAAERVDRDALGPTNSPGPEPRLPSVSSSRPSGASFTMRSRP